MDLNDTLQNLILRIALEEKENAYHSRAMEFFYIGCKRFPVCRVVHISCLLCCEIVLYFFILSLDLVTSTF